MWHIIATVQYCYCRMSAIQAYHSIAATDVHGVQIFGSLESEYVLTFSKDSSYHQVINGIPISAYVAGNAYEYFYFNMTQNVPLVRWA
jgi:hypothetical protein